ncbi:glycosyltransferase family 4 protein [Arcticibacter tournemirensis]
MKAKILIYFNSLQKSGGIERVIATLSKKFSSSYSVTILVKDCPNSFYSLNEEIRIESLNKELRLNMHNRFSRIFASAFNAISCIGVLRFFLKNNTFDFYYVAHPLNVLEFRLAGAEKGKIIIAEHGSMSAYNWIYKNMKKILYKDCYKYVVPTRSDAELYYRAGYPVVCIPHFRSDLEYSFSGEVQKVVLNIGRFTPDKQQIKLLYIWKRVIDKLGVKNWKLRIVGSGELEGQLKKVISLLMLENFVEVLPPTKNVELHYRDASIFVLTSRSEGFGMVLLEAISFGLPCVSYDCPSGPRDIINHTYNGYLVKLGDAKEFSEKLIYLMSNPQLLKTMKSDAFESSNNWKDDVIMDKWNMILNKQGL